MAKEGLCFFIFMLWGSGIFAQIVFPTPENYERGSGWFRLKKEIRYHSEHSSAWEACFQQMFSTETGRSVKKVLKGKPDFRFIREEQLPSEAYRLVINPGGIEVFSGSDVGFFYALQTLRQLMEKTDGEIVWPCLSISDNPRYGWRSFLLDSGRQYQRPETIRKYIDMAATLKMNYFHWHLTEGLGWRMEIKKYPQLTAKGAFVGRGTEQQGYYSQEEIRELVKYAAERYVTIVPEIDIPGHAEAALTAYPEYGCFGEVPRIPETGFTQTIFCAGKSATLRFLKDILDEVCDLFPSAYIHLGGDEAPKGNWDECPDCQARIRQVGLKDSHALQLWLSAELASYLKAKGRKAIFWEDVLLGETFQLPDNVVIQWWNWRAHRDRLFQEALRRGYEVICGTNYYTYLNFPVTPWEGYGEDRTFDLRTAYEGNPSMNRDTNTLVLGMSCALWTDYGVTEDLLDQRLFPRIFALAEQMWHRGNYLSFQEFYGNIENRKSWFESLGYRFGPAF